LLNTDTSPSADMNAMLLFTFLGATLGRDTGSPGFAGSLAIGVLDGGDAVWWRAIFRDRGHTDLLDHRPTDVDAWITLTPSQALQIMTGALKDLPEGAVTGDKQLIRKFVLRYLKVQKGVALRAGLGAARG
jgi:hypothetical protein